MALILLNIKGICWRKDAVDIINVKGFFSQCSIFTLSENTYCGKACECNEYGAFSKCSDLTRHQRINNKHETYEQKDCEKARPSATTLALPNMRELGLEKSPVDGTIVGSPWGRTQTTLNITQFTQEKHTMNVMNVDIGNSYIE